MNILLLDAKYIYKCCLRNVIKNAKNEKRKDFL